MLLTHNTWDINQDDNVLINATAIIFTSLLKQIHCNKIRVKKITKFIGDELIKRLISTCGVDIELSIKNTLV